MVEQWNSYGGTVENDGGTKEQLWWNSGTDIVEQWNRYSRTVEQMYWNS